MMLLKAVILSTLVGGFSLMASAQDQSTVADEEWVEDAKIFIAQAEDPPTSDEEFSQLHLAQWGPPPPPRRVWTCFARGRNGTVFSGQSSNSSSARRIAMSRCAARSNSCHFSSCR